MKLSIKSAVLAAVAAAGMASSFSALALDNPSTGNGSLVLFVTNTTTNAVYVRDLGLSMNSLITEGTGAGQTADPTYVAVNTLNLSISPVTADQTLLNFLGTGGVGEFTWNLIGGDSVGSNTLGTRRFALTTPADLTAISPPSNSALGTLGTAEVSFFNSVATALGAATSVVTTSGGGAGQINTTLLNGFFNQAPQSTVGALDSSLNFFVVTSGGGSNAVPARVFALNDLKLAANGTLASIASVSEVPLPAGVWLFGSGLMGLLGIGRRKQPSPVAA